MKTWKPAPYGMRDNPGVFDTGNGAIKTIEERDAHPGVERVTIRSYCGRSADNCRYYRLISDTAQTFDTLAAACHAASSQIAQFGRALEASRRTPTPKPDKR